MSDSLDIGQLFTPKRTKQLINLNGSDTEKADHIKEQLAIFINLVPHRP
ncbi:hypothetical protein [Paraglaciecola sp.]